MNISGEDYVKYFPFNETSKEAVTQTFYIPRKITAEVEVADNICSNFSKEIGSNKALVFKSYNGSESYDESSAKEFSSSTVGDLAVQKNIIQLEPVTVVYTLVSGSMSNDVHYVVFKATLSDGSTMYVAMTNTDYTTKVNPGGTAFTSSTLSTGGGDGTIELSKATFYGFAVMANTLASNLSNTTGSKILVFDHIG